MPYTETKIRRRKTGNRFPALHVNPSRPDPGFGPGRDRREHVMACRDCKEFEVWKGEGYCNWWRRNVEGSDTCQRDSSRYIVPDPAKGLETPIWGLSFIFDDNGVVQAW